MRGYRLLALFAISLLLLGCSGSDRHLVPVNNLTQSANQIPKSYTVRTGDSLYMIAMEFDLDHLDIARWNGIVPPYTIHRGERLRLRPPARAVARSGGKCSGSHYQVAPGDTLSEIAEYCGLSLARLAAWNRLASPYRLQVDQRLRLRPGERAKRSPATVRAAMTAPPDGGSKVAIATTERPKASSSARSGLFRRPVSGKILRRYSVKSGSTGMEFGGKQGDPVYAAGGGKVVYSGSRLVRYGNLLIIRHDNNLLTAYAHNSRLLVQEGDSVETGQQIAAMGNSGTDRVKLHFEVRKGGKPVDPLHYLGE